MAWSTEIGRYSIACREIEGPRGTITVTVVENGQELRQEVFTKTTSEGPIEFTARVWDRIWQLLDEFRPRMMQGLWREWESQAREG